MNRAVKVLHPDVVAERPDLWQRMKLEAQVMNRLAHPNVMQVFDLVEQGNQICVVMDLADGGTLADWLVLLGPMPPRHALGYLVQVLSALATAHVNGIVHRDVKPQNILVDRRGVALLSDFGAALHAGPDDDALAVIGTTGFMAPEQLSHAQVVGAPADLYGIAATLYTLLTTRSPSGLCDEDADSPRWAGLTDDLVALLRRGLAADPKDRFESAIEMARAFEQARASAPSVPLRPYEPDHEDFFPAPDDAAAETLGWGHVQAHLPPYPAAIQIALSFLDDPPLFREVEVGASLLAVPTHESGGTLVAPDESWMSPEEAIARDRVEVEVEVEEPEAPPGRPSQGAPTTEDVVGFDPAAEPLGYLRDDGSSEPLGYLPDDSELSDLLPPEASELPEEVLAAQWAERVERRRLELAEAKKHRIRQGPATTDDKGVRPLRPLRVGPDEQVPLPAGWRVAQRPEAVEEPFQGPELPRLPYNLLIGLAGVVAVLVVGIQLGGGFDRVPAAATVLEPVQAPLDLVQAPRPREVIREAVEPSPPPQQRARAAPAPGPATTAPAAVPPPDAPDLASDPLGRWDGVMGGRQTRVVLRGRPSAFRGTVTVTFMTANQTTTVSGSWDPENRTLSFEDLDPVPDAGRYWGTVSDDGTEFVGAFERLDGAARVPLVLRRKP